MKTISSLSRTIVILISLVAFTSCKDYLNDSINSDNIGLPGEVSVMNTDLTNAKSRTGEEQKAPDIHNSKMSGAKGNVYLRYTTTPGIQLRYSNKSLTRGTAIAGNNFYNSYCLYTYNYPNSYTWAANGQTISSLYPDEQVVRNRNWSTNEFWPGVGQRCAFFAYAPYHTTGVSAFTTTGWPTFHYTVPTNATDQNDLLVTKNKISSGIGDYGNIDVPGNFNMKDSITFDHACTAIRIAIGKQMAPCTIKKIEICNVNSEGDYQYQTENWANIATLSTFTLTQDFEIKPGDSNYILNNDNNVFMMIPQKVPLYATINVTINDGVEHVLKASIDNDTWAKGYTVTYYLSTTEVDNTYVLSVSSSATTLPLSGGTNTMTINSYKQTYYGSQVAVPWTATYTYDESGITGTTIYNSTTPAVTSFTATSNGSITGQNVNFSLGAGSVSSVLYRSSSQRNSHTKTLREAVDGSCDLSNGKQTANCYVVSAPGHYSFPLVYGNALNADKTANTNSYGTTTFVDHQGAMITSPYIYLTNGGVNIPYDACIVWQDAPQLVTPSSVKLSSDMHGIEFDVDRNNICQGNCLIAVRDKDQNIMWSWHIWVTDHDMAHTYEVHNNSNVGGAVTSKFMEVPLGWCDSDVRIADPFRIFHLTIKQSDELGQSAAQTISQVAGDYTYGANAPFYQWGRKDPLLPSDGTTNTDKPYYDTQYNPRGSVNSTAIKDVILYPYKFNTSTGNGSLELWNKGNTIGTVNNNTIYKTIYSPSPANYVEPKSAAYTGFSQSNSTGGFNKGLNFYSYPNSTGPTIFFPALGYYNNSLAYVNTMATYWAGPASATSATHLGFDASNLYTNFENPRTYGFSIYPVSE